MQKSETQSDYKALNVTSPAFKPDGNIPSRYSCDGADLNPALDISAIPVEAKSLVLIVEDPDATTGSWLHWLVWNIPVTHHIREGVASGVQGLNDFGRNTYGGPCPPTGMHRYFFRIYALDDVLNLAEGSRRKDVEKAMRDHICAYGELIGHYKRIAP